MQKSTLGVENHVRSQRWEGRSSCAVPHPPCSVLVDIKSIVFIMHGREVSPPFHSVLTSLPFPPLQNKLSSQPPATLRTQSLLILLIRSMTQLPKYRTKFFFLLVGGGQKVGRNPGHPSKKQKRGTFATPLISNSSSHHHAQHRIISLFFSETVLSPIVYSNEPTFSWLFTHPHAFHASRMLLLLPIILGTRRNIHFHFLCLSRDSAAYFTPGRRDNGLSTTVIQSLSHLQNKFRAIFPAVQAQSSSHGRQTLVLPL